MEARILARTVLLLCLWQLLALRLPGCSACSEPEGWQPLPIQDRVSSEDVQYAVLANVTDTTAPRFVRRFGGDVYGAQIAVECVYKRPSLQSVYESASVIGFGESNDCTTTDVEAGRRYVFLMAPYQAGFAVVESNVQLAAEPATPEIEQTMQDSFGCDPPSEPTTPPPTTTPVATTVQPTTEPATTTVAATTPQAPRAPQEPEAGDDEEGGDRGGSARVSSLGVLSVLALLWSRVLTS